MLLTLVDLVNRRREEGAEAGMGAPIDLTTKSHSVGYFNAYRLLSSPPCRLGFIASSSTKFPREPSLPADLVRLSTERGGIPCSTLLFDCRGALLRLLADFVRPSTDFRDSLLFRRESGLSTEVPHVVLVLLPLSFESLTVAPLMTPISKENTRRNREDEVKRSYKYC